MTKLKLIINNAFRSMPFDKASVVVIMLLLITSIWSNKMHAQSAGTYDPSFMSVDIDQNIRVLLPQEDGKILVGGSFNSIQGAPIQYLTRLNSDGTLDNTFQTGTGPNGVPYCLLPFGADKYFIAGLFTEYDGVPMNRIALINNDGSLDMSFSSPTGLNGAVLSVCYSYDQTRLLIGGAFTSPFSGIAMYDFSGALDNTFNPGSGIADPSNPQVLVILARPTSIVIGGSFNEFDGNAVGFVAQLLPDGSFDAFSNNSGLGASGPVFGIESMPFGQMMLSGIFTTYDGNQSSCVVRVATDLGYTLPSVVGTGFTGNLGVVRETHIMPDGKLMMVGSFNFYGGVFSANGIIRLNNDMTVDLSFNSGTGTGTGSTIIMTLEPTGDGRFLISGGNLIYDGNAADGMARIYGDACFSRLRGTVTLDGQPVSNGKVYVYTEEIVGIGYTRADTADIVNGEYQFDDLPEFAVSYILQAVPDPSTYPSTVAIPTFFSPQGPSHKWNDPLLSYSLNSVCGSIDTVNITVLQPEAAMVAPGTGTLSGQLRWAENKRPVEDPIPIIDIVVELVPPGTTAFAHTQTDVDGNYSFPNLPLTVGQTYVYGIHVSIPGNIMQNTYLVGLTEENQTLTGLDFLCDTVENIIFTVGGNGTSVQELSSNSLSIYPSPMKDFITVTVPDKMKGELTAEVFDLSGRKVFSLTGLSGSHIRIQRNGLAAGTHVLHLIDEQGVQQTGVFVVGD